MKTSKLFTILKTFSDDEMIRFEKFIISPYHNTGRNLKPLFKILKKHYPEFPNERLSHEKICKVLGITNNTDVKRSSSQLNVRLSELTKLAESFTVVDNLIRDKYQFSKNLSEIYKNRKLYNYSISRVNECSKLLDEKGIDEEYALQRLQLQRIISKDYVNLNKIEQSLNAERSLPLNLLSFFISNIKVQLFHGNSMNAELLKLLVDSIDYDKTDRLCKDDGSGVKDKLLFDLKRSQFYIYKEEKVFWELIDYYKNHFTKFSRYLKWQYYLGLMRSGIELSYERGFIFCGSELNSLTDFIFSKNIYSHSNNEYLEDKFFTTIIGLKFGLESSESIQKFSDTYVKKVHPDFNERAKNYAEAFINFKSKKYENSLDSIQLITRPISAEKNLLYKLKIANFFELNYAEEMHYLLDSYNHVLNSNRKYRSKDQNINFITLIKIIQEYSSKKISPGRKEKQKLIEESKTSEFHWWIKEKIEEL
jgi:hypothetical protein